MSIGHCIQTQPGGVAEALEVKKFYCHFQLFLRLFEEPSQENHLLLLERKEQVKACKFSGLIELIDC